MMRRLRILLDLAVWRYGTVIGGRSARRNRWTGEVQLRTNGVWQRAHPGWRGLFRPF